MRLLLGDGLPDVPLLQRAGWRVLTLKLAERWIHYLPIFRVRPLSSSYCGKVATTFENRRLSFN